MRNQLERRRLALRAAAFCAVFLLLCGCLLPAFAEGGPLPDSEPGQTQDEDEPVPPENEVLEEEPEIPENPAGLEETDETPFPEEEKETGLLEPQGPEASGSLPEEETPADSREEEPEEYFEMTYLFWLSEKDEAEGGLPYAEQTVGSGNELMMPEDPEAEGSVFRYWYIRDEDGTAERFVPPEEALWPKEDGEQSLYAYFVVDTPEEPLPEEDDSPELTEEILPELEEEEEKPTENEEMFSEERQEKELEKEPETAESEPIEEDAFLEEEQEKTLSAWVPEENAAVFLLRSPTCLPGSNDPSQWAPDNSECRWVGRVNTSGAVWSDGRNITGNVSSYITAWPDGTTDEVWTLTPGSSWWDDVVDEIWDEYKESIEDATGIVGLTRDDLESITVTPYKISRDNYTDPDKHIDCTISVKSKKSFTARFNVRAPGEDDYIIVDSCEYQSGDKVEKTGVQVEQQFDIGGVLYVFDGWYREDSGPAVDAPGEILVTQDEWDEGYLPDNDELENGVVNFYAHYVLADIDPDTGVTVEFFAVPLMLGAAAAGLGRKNKKKEENE